MTQNQHMMGGWSHADIRSSRVHEAAVFACRHAYRGQFVSYMMLTARQQVVAGMKYEFILDVLARNVDNGEIVEYRRHFIVYDRFGEYSLEQQTT
jgi:hypothetical protein